MNQQGKQKMFMFRGRVRWIKKENGAVRVVGFNLAEKVAGAAPLFALALAFHRLKYGGANVPA